MKRASEISIAGIAQLESGFARSHPHRHVTRFAGRSMATGRARAVNQTDLLGEQIVFRHIGEPPKCAYTLWLTNRPPGFFMHLAMQSGHRTFAVHDLLVSRLVDELGGNRVLQ